VSWEKLSLFVPFCYLPPVFKQEKKKRRDGELPACLLFYCMPLYMASKEPATKSIRIHSGKSSAEIGGVRAMTYYGHHAFKMIVRLQVPGRSFA
jgi:hypothetical protein